MKKIKKLNKTGETDLRDTEIFKKKKFKKVNLEKLIDNATDVSKLSSKDLMKSKLAMYMVRGLSLDEACKLSGCSKVQLINFRNDPEFNEFVEKNIANNKHEYLQAIHSASQMGAWQAAAWYLERKFPDEFGKRDIVRHEYAMKIQTFQTIVLKILNGIDPGLKIRVLRELKNYKFDGSSINSEENEFYTNTLSLPYFDDNDKDKDIDV